MAFKSFLFLLVSYCLCFWQALQGSTPYELISIDCLCHSIYLWCVSSACPHPFFYYSLTKWYCTPICFVLEWKAGFLAICMALWLSQYTEIFYCLCSSSSINLWIQIASLYAWVAAIYLTSIIDKATTICNLDNQLTTPPASMNT